jgi:prephenate dehydrogenase
VKSPPTAIIGLGLMGGSLARELAERGVPVLAYDLTSAVVSAAVAEGVVGVALDDNLEGVAGAEVVVIATPVDAALTMLARLVPHLSEQAVVTDLGSTKRAISARAEQLGIGERFVGSHPLAGDHRSGWVASRLGLFESVPVFLCPTTLTTPGTMARIDEFWARLGAERRTIAPAEHDRRMAWVSHLPQVASSLLAASVGQAGFLNSDLGPAGREMTRLAASSPAMWSAISLANADYLEAAVLELQYHLDEFRKALETRISDALREFFRAAGERLSGTIPEA